MDLTELKNRHIKKVIHDEPGDCDFCDLLAIQSAEIAQLRAELAAAREFNSTTNRNYWFERAEVLEADRINLANICKNWADNYGLLEAELTQLRAELAAARESQHHEDCDTRDMMIQGKPCNCYLMFQAELTQLREQLEPNRHHREQWVKNYGDACGVINMARMLLDRLDFWNAQAVLPGEYDSLRDALAALDAGKIGRVTLSQVAAELKGKLDADKESK